MRTQIRLLVASTLFLISIGAAAVAHAEPEEDAEQTKQEVFTSSESSESVALEPEWERWDGTTVALQSLAGVGTGVLGAVVVGAVAARTCDPHPDFGCSFEAILAGSVGGALSTSIGVFAVGALSEGDGNGWATLLGSALGGFVGVIPAFPMLFASDQVAILGVAAFFGTATLGGIIGYHASSSQVIMPQVGVAPTDGGMTLSLGVEF